MINRAMTKTQNRKKWFDEIQTLSRQLSLETEAEDRRLSYKQFKSRKKELTRQILFRNKNREKAKSIADEYKMTLKTQDNASRDDWVREVRNLRRRVKTKEKTVEWIEPQKLINDILNGRRRLNNAEARKFYERLQSGRYISTIVLDLGGLERTFQQVFSNTFQDNIMMRTFLTTGRFPTETEEMFGSGLQETINISSILEFRVSPLPVPENPQENGNGAFYPKINSTDIDLSKYQIYNQEQAYDVGDNREDCLIHALICSGVDNCHINGIKEAYPFRSIKTTDLYDIASRIKKNISLSFYDRCQSRKRQTSRVYPSKKVFDYGDTIELGIINQHYIINEKTKYSRYSIRNYNEVKDLTDFHDIHRKDHGSYRRDSEIAKLTSLELIKLLNDEGHFIKGDMSMFQEATRLKTNDVYLDNIAEEQCPYKKPNITDDKVNIWFADTEAFTQGNHKLAMIGYVSINENSKTKILSVCEGGMTPQKTVNYFLSDISREGDCVVYFHNVRYDYNIFRDYIKLKNKCEKDNNLYSFTVSHYGKNIEFRDSYKLYNQALKNMPNTFNLPPNLRKAEAIAYDYYTPDNYNTTINSEKYKEYLSLDDRKIFDQNIKPTNNFHPWNYYKEYLKLDCEVLKHGLIKFNEIILDITNQQLSIFNRLTISSFSDKYLGLEGVYDGVFENSRNIRKYVQQAVRGGRVNVNQKFLKKVVEEKIADYDGVSLYPSAMARLCDPVLGIGGIPIGEAKVLEKPDEWNTKIYSIITVEITKINKKQDMPIISYVDDNDILQYTNNVSDLPKFVTLDSITLEDYIEFCNIEFNVLSGIYWDNGVNPKMGEVVKRLFNERLKAKKDKNTSLSEVLKLILNSAYGKTGTKPHHEKNSIRNNTRFVKCQKEKKYVLEDPEITKKRNDKYTYNNYNTIKSIEVINNEQKEYTIYAPDNSFNRNHIACMILSMSKRIMNEVFNVANDLKIPIYYTDTDSIHLPYEGVSKIESEYRNRYNRELTGKQLGQFHIDFDLKGSVGEVYSTKFIALGKKSYFDKLEGKDKDGNTITGYHTRMKGVSRAGLEHERKKYPNGYEDLYEKLSKGDKVEFILNPTDVENNKRNPNFLFKDGNVSIRPENSFTREVQF